MVLAGYRLTPSTVCLSPQCQLSRAGVFILCHLQLSWSNDSICSKRFPLVGLVSRQTCWWATGEGDYISGTGQTCWSSPECFCLTFSSSFPWGHLVHFNFICFFGWTTMCKYSHSLTRRFFLNRIIVWPLFCNGMRGNEPGSVCSSCGELVVGTYKNNSSNARCTEYWQQYT